MSSINNEYHAGSRPEYSRAVTENSVSCNGTASSVSIKLCHCGSIPSVCGRAVRLTSVGFRPATLPTAILSLLAGTPSVKARILSLRARIDLPGAKINLLQARIDPFGARIDLLQAKTLSVKARMTPLGEGKAPLGAGNFAEGAKKSPLALSVMTFGAGIFTVQVAVATLPAI